MTCVEIGTLRNQILSHGKVMLPFSPRGNILVPENLWKLSQLQLGTIIYS